RAVRLRRAAAAAIVVAPAGGLVGVGVASLVGRLAFGSARFGASPAAAVVWTVSSVAVGWVVALATVTVPAWRDARTVSVAAARADVGRQHRPLALRLGLDGWLLAGAGLVFWLASRSGYNLVLAPEG